MQECYSAVEHKMPFEETERRIEEEKLKHEN